MHSPWHCRALSSHADLSSIFWDNAGGSLYPAHSGYMSSPVISCSAIECDPVWPGEGNISADPRFCGWGQASEVHVDAAAAAPGDGSADHPFPTLGPEPATPFPACGEDPRAAGPGCKAFGPCA